MKKRFYLIISLLFFLAGLSKYASASNNFTATNSNWSNPANWSGGLPIAGQYIVIPAGKTCLVDCNTNQIDSIRIDGTLNFTPNNLSDLKVLGNITIGSTGLVYNDGTIEKGVMTGGSTLNKFTIQGNGLYQHNPYNNVLLDESIFMNGNEDFSMTSTLIIKKWFDISIPVGDFSRVAVSIFGNVTLSVNTTGLRWNQKGCFGISRIKGTLTITDGIIQMDDGQGASASLILQTVNITNTGSMIVRSGAAAGFTFTTGAFTDNSTAIDPTVLADTTFCLFTWNTTGSVQLGHLFYGMVGTGTDPGGDLRVNITGNLTINTPTMCHFVTQCDAPLRLAVTGATTISGTPTKVRFVDGNNGLMNFTTNDFIISGGNDNVLLGGNPAIVPKATGIATVVINNDFLINGSSVNYIVNSDTNAQKLRLTVGRDFVMSNTGAQLIVANHLGANTFKTTRHLTITGGRFTGEMDTANVAVDSMIVGGDFTFNSPLATNYFYANASKGNTIFLTTGNFNVLSSGTAVGQGVYGIYVGSGTLNMSIGGNYVQGPAASQCNCIFNNKQWLTNGSLTFNCGGMFDQNGGIFRGINSPANSNTSIITFTVNSIDYDGGYFSAYHTANNANGVAAFNITNNCKVNFTTAATDSFMFVGMPFVTPDFCYLTANISIGGNLVISGVNGAFVSSFGKNAELYNIVGNVNISAGNNSFNPSPPVVNTTHNVTINVGGSFNVSGGTTNLSELNDSINLTVNGSLNITGGTLIIKGQNGPGVANILGGFSMTGGTFYLHKNLVTPSSDPIVVTINSDDVGAADNFTHTGGTINYDDNSSGNPVLPSTIVVMSPNYTIGGSGIITRNFGGGLYGALRFTHQGVTNFNRTSTTHNIQSIKQYIDDGTTVDVVSGNFQISSAPATFTFDLLNILYTGRLEMRTNSIKSNLTLPNSGITVYGTLALQHPNGMYNGTAAAAIDASGAMNYFLQGGSTVEYYGTANQIITGMNQGLATVGLLHKYYYLDINMGPGAWAYPTNTPTVNSVYVKKKLNLLAGELNLDNDHVTANGGRCIIVEDSTAGAITKVSGYIRSETEDGSGKLRWNIGRQTGPHIIPFAYSAAPGDTIPFTFAVNTGDADTLSVSTYHTAANNMPYPPTVLHVRNNFGLDNSANTVDRFWFIALTGTTNNASMTFRVLNPINGATLNEMPAMATLRAQRWIPPNSWELAYQGVQTNPINNGTLVTGATLFPNWWTLSANNSPLPVEMLSFAGSCEGKNTSLVWTTASEINNDHFTVIRSNDGVNYEAVGVVPGHGNSTVNNSYKFVDENPVAHFSYYKLIQEDYDGHKEEFGPVIVQNCKLNPGLDVVVANQETGNTNLLVQSPYAGNFHVEVLTAEGQLILSTDKYIAEGSSLVALTTDQLNTGIYYVRLQSDRDVITKKVFITNN